jgi:hypothetical protein
VASLLAADVGQDGAGLEGRSLGQGVQEAASRRSGALALDGDETQRVARSMAMNT